MTLRRRAASPRTRVTAGAPRRRRSRKRVTTAAPKKVNHRIWPGKLIKHERGECRWCGETILRADGTVNRRRTFCDWRCVDEFLLRVEPARMRMHVFMRDRGKCQECGEVFPKFTSPGWEADHILPLWAAAILGDWTAWDPSNLRVLCTDPCHKAKTKADRTTWAHLKPKATPSSPRRPRP